MNGSGIIIGTAAKTSLLATPLLLLVVLAMLMLPIPPFLLDFLFSFNITLSLILLILTIYISRPLDFSLFPTLLLVATLLRLALNIASTRVVLINGHEGPYAAGKVIEAFGSVVIAGNYFVGLLVFLILVIVNFVVITKGGSRISEVTARFVLDSMPGKQMAIDADLNSGVIDHNEAKTKREDITREADFYGAMDGASKFVRGDAIAGLMILLINILGGVTIGIWQYDMNATEAAHLYGLMTIGDGLVAQIPSLLLSTAAAIMVTRISKATDMSYQVRQEIMGQPKALMVAAGVLIIIGLVPGMPHVAFVIPGLLMLLFVHRQAARREAQRQQALVRSDDENDLKAGERLSWQDIATVDPVGLNIGYRVIALLSDDPADAVNNGQLASQIRQLRRELSEQYGFLVPMIHIRDNLSLDPESYTISLHNVVVDQFTLHIGQLLAIAMEGALPLGATSGSPATVVKDPSYGLNAYWIATSQRETSLQQGYTVVDCATVITTHVGKVIEDHIDDLFGFEETQGWLAHLRQLSPKLCDELVPDRLPPGLLMQVLKRLLADNVAIADSPRIAATLLAVEQQRAETQRDVLNLLRQVRITLCRQIIEPLLNRRTTPEQLSVFTLSHELEKMLLTAREQASRDPQFSEETFALEPGLSMQLQKNMPELIHQAHTRKIEPVLLVAPQLWPLLSRYSRISHFRALTILSFMEIPDDLQVEVIGQLG